MQTATPAIRSETGIELRKIPPHQFGKKYFYDCAGL